MRIIEGADAQTWKSIKVEDLFEITNFIGSKIKHAQRY